jgi:hypothetical protein
VRRLAAAFAIENVARLAQARLEPFGVLAGTTLPKNGRRATKFSRVSLTNPDRRCAAHRIRRHSTLLQDFQSRSRPRPLHFQYDRSDIVMPPPIGRKELHFVEEKIL